MNSLEDFICALSFNHKHFLDEPIILSCGHASCIKCFQDLKNNTGSSIFNCLKCDEKNSFGIEMNFAKSNLIKKYMNANADKILESLSQEFEETFKKAKNKINEMDEHVEVQVDYWKEEVEIRAESLKIEIEKIKENLIIKLDKIKGDFKEVKIKELNKINANANDEAKNSKDKEKLECNRGDCKGGLNMEDLQLRIKKQRQNLDYLNSINLNVDFKMGNGHRLEVLFGEIDYHFDNLVETIDAKDHQIVCLDYKPNFFYTLPNRNLVIGDSLSNNFKIYNEEFKLIKVVNRFDRFSFYDSYRLKSNDKDSIYLTDPLTNNIIKTDLDFKFIKKFDSNGLNSQQLDKPMGIECYEDSVYVCDTFNKRIFQISEDLVYEESYPLNFLPCNIKIIKNVACIRSYDSPSKVNLFNLNPFSFKTRISTGTQFEIYSINSWFYVYKQLDKRIECYDINGNLVDNKDLDNINEEVKQIYLFGYFNNRFILGTREGKNVIII